MEFQKRSSIVLCLFLFFVIHTQIEAVGSLNQPSLPSVDLKRHHLTSMETMSFSTDIMRRQLAGGGSSGGGGGSRGGSTGGSSGGGGGSRGGSTGGSSSGGGSRGGGGGSRGGGTGGRGGGDDGDGGDSGGGGGIGGGSGSGNTRPSTTTTTQGGRFPSGAVHLQYSVVWFIFTACLVIMY